MTGVTLRSIAAGAFVLSRCASALTVPEAAADGVFLAETDGYIPKNSTCPSPRPSIRPGTSLSQQEAEWLPSRRNTTIDPIRDFLKRCGIHNFDVDAYLFPAGLSSPVSAARLPNVGIAISGGGYRAMLNGAGALAAWDSRTTNSTQKGHLGGLLQSATYLSALSGGGWLVGSMYLNNFSSVEALKAQGGIWQFGDSILEGPPNTSFIDYYRQVFDAVSEKKKAGFERSITDYWGRMLSYQLINAPQGGPALTFSSIAANQQFSSGAAPLPLLVADGRAPNEKLLPTNATIFEFTPWELGSYDRTLRGFVPLEFIGSEFEAGILAENKTCVRGFDNAGFVMGTSSSLFNQVVFFLSNGSTGVVPEAVPDFVVSAITSLLSSIGEQNNDIADFTPNAFYHWTPPNDGVTPAIYSAEKRLTLVDGGEDLQNIPYHPLLLDHRNVDVIVSIDSSADTKSGWPDGASIVATYQRSLEEIADGTSFPVVPGKKSFLNLGLNDRPVFFGCNSNKTALDAEAVSSLPPLVVYIPYHPYVYTANISTWSTSVNNTERDAIVANGYQVATMGNGTRDPEWPVCMACAILLRSFQRDGGGTGQFTNTTPSVFGAGVPAGCELCLRRYCWDGSVDESGPKEYWPPLFGNRIDVSDARFNIQWPGVAMLWATILAGCFLIW